MLIHLKIALRLYSYELSMWFFELVPIQHKGDEKHTKYIQTVLDNPQKDPTCQEGQKKVQEKKRPTFEQISVRRNKWIIAYHLQLRGSYWYCFAINSRFSRISLFFLESRKWFGTKKWARAPRLPKQFKKTKILGTRSHSKAISY